MYYHVLNRRYQVGSFQIVSVKSSQPLEGEGCPLRGLPGMALRWARHRQELHSCFYGLGQETFAYDQSGAAII